MLTKFETKSSRVKSVSFHPKRPWVLAALHTGTIQLWDYKLGTLVDRFDEHEGPVRGVCFHPTQPLFVSAGDDYKIKLWNWKQRRCIYTFTGHLDYIRSVSFHSESPWIISASDDQTIRIWNWQSRNCISILTGHSHYVMSAEFHQKEDLIVSASLDQTVRVWDISGLRKKHAAGAPIVEDPMRGPGGNADVFGNMDAVVKYVLEGHSRGVNYATFHPSLPLIISGGDDRLVKLWRWNDSKAWEVDTCRGHFSNINHCMFHPRLELIISAAEDKTIRIWDMSKRTALQTYRRENDRFWSFAAHPELNLFAAGHDNGLVVFKLERERPAYMVHGDAVFFVKDKFVRQYQFSTADDTPLIAIRKGPVGVFSPHRTLSYNPAEHAVLLASANEGGSYELYNLPKDKNASAGEAEAKRGVGSSAIFVARNRFAVLEKGQIYIKDLGNNVTKHLKPEEPVSEIFFAGGKNILLVTPTAVILFDTESRVNVGELNIAGVRYTQWSHDQSYCAFITKHNIVIANKDLEQVAMIHETIKIKSGAWDESGIFVYSTLNHLKYGLTNGDTGIIKTLEQPMYVVKVKSDTIFCIDRESRIKVVQFDPTEYRFKMALIARDYDQVFHIIKTSNLVGQSIIGYLQKKGYPEIALQFVKDPKTRYDLALQCGNIEVALEMAKVIELPEYWSKLGQEAMAQGNLQVVEYVYQRTKSFDLLSFLYLITGNQEKLQKMLKIAQHRGDIMSTYQNALYLGDVHAQVHTLQESGQYPLAYLAAKTYGLEEEASAIVQAVGLEAHPPVLQNAKLLVPAHPVLKKLDSDWPVKQNAVPVPKQESVKPVQKQVQKPVEIPVEEQANVEAEGWGDEIEIDFSPEKAEEPEEFADAGEGWDIDEDLDIPLSEPSPVKEAKHFVAPTRGPPVTSAWIRNSRLPADHIAAGSFESAMQLLNHQAGVVIFQPLKPHFMAIYQACKTHLASVNGVSPLQMLLTRSNEPLLPLIPFTVKSLRSQIDALYQAMAGAKFTEVILLGQTIIHQCLVSYYDPSETGQVREIIDICREYILGGTLAIARKTTEDPKRSMELAVYFTHCKLQPAHLQQVLKLAMLYTFKLKNFATALVLAQRLLDLVPPAELQQSCRKIIQYAQRNNADETQLQYDQFNPFSLCGQTLTPIYLGSQEVQCPLCATHYTSDLNGQVCTTCQVSKIGHPRAFLQ
ncbi:coatomer WD associated region-domain-containing protein [Gorgonomyces haynaldii]|nr:coatomer WD associated region-domain-containing protein [Gorgonomyces haynaldii]